MPIQAGQEAPEVALYSSDKEAFKLSDYRGSKRVVLLFFPGAFTGVCTNELNMVNNDLAAYGEDTQVVGISTDSPFALGEFKKVNALNFPLLSDHNATVCATYGAKYSNNFTDMNLDRIAKRSAFVVDKDGKVSYAEVLENAGELPNLEAIQALLNG